jgi:hypothetical protein
MTRAQLAQALVAGVRPPSSFGRMIMAFETEKRTVSIAAVAPDRVPPPPAPTDAELQAFYTAQSRAFALPEFRAFTIIRADPAAFEARVEVSEEKIKEAFEFQKTRLVTPERRSFVLISGGDQAKAEQAARREPVRIGKRGMGRRQPCDEIVRSVCDGAHPPRPHVQQVAVEGGRIGDAQSEIGRAVDQGRGRSTFRQPRRQHGTGKAPTDNGHAVDGISHASSRWIGGF